MSDTINIRQRMASLDSSPEFNVYSKVIINVDDTTAYEVGDDTGRTFEIDIPWGTQEMANNILQSLRGFQYQPMKASGALLDPAAEIGDGLTASGIYSGIFNLKTKFGRLMRADIEAPEEEAVDHEYPYKTPTDRAIRRERAQTKAEFEVQAQQIAAKVSRTGGDARSFGWTLTEEGFVISSNNKQVFIANDDGIIIDGTIRARSGYIGNDTYGFHIKDNAIYNGVQSYSDTQHTGIYLGTDGIVLGQGRFKVDSYGNLYAQSGTFNGTVSAGNIAYGGSAGYFNGGGISSGSIGTGQTNDYINNGVADGFSAINGLYGGWTSSPDLGAATNWGKVPRTVIQGTNGRFVVFGYRT